VVLAGQEVQEDRRVLAAQLGLRVPWDQEGQEDREVPPLTWVSQEVQAGLEDLAAPRYRADQAHREVREARRR
jgi:hypothetical protein